MFEANILLSLGCQVQSESCDIPGKISGFLGAVVKPVRVLLLATFLNV